MVNSFVGGPYFLPVAIIFFFVLPPLLFFKGSNVALIVAAIGLLAAWLAYQKTSKYYADVEGIDQYLAQSSQYSLVKSAALPSSLWDSLPLLRSRLLDADGHWKVYRLNSEPEAFVFFAAEPETGGSLASPFYNTTLALLPMKDAAYDGVLYLFPNWFMVGDRWALGWKSSLKKRNLNESYELAYSADEPSGTLLAELSEWVAEPLRRAHGADPFIEVRSPWMLVILEGAPTKELMMAISEMRL